MQPIQMRLSQREKTFSEFLFEYLKSTLSFKHLSKKLTLIADVFREIPASKNMVR